MSEEQENRFVVVLNDEQQYSIWPTSKPLPAGWASDDFEGSRAECVAYVDRVWTDMRPLSLRVKMQAV